MGALCAQFCTTRLGKKEERAQVSLEILMDGKTEEKSRAFAAILMATWRAMAW